MCKSGYRKNSNHSERCVSSRTIHISYFNLLDLTDLVIKCDAIINLLTTPISLAAAPTSPVSEFTAAVG